MNRNTIAVLFFVHLVVYSDAQFINNPGDMKIGCTGRAVEFTWTYIDTSTPVFFVQWRVNGTRIASEDVSAGQPFSPTAAYTGRLTKISNAHISLGSLSKVDVGKYECEVTYTDGNGFISNQISLTVNDELDNETKIEMTLGDGMVTLSPVFYDSSITYTWKSQNSVIHVGSPLAVKENGNYTLCISGGIADCLNPALNSCASIVVTGLDGLTTRSSTISSDMSATVSEVPPPLVTTSSAGLSQEIVITITISSIIAAGVLIFLTVLIVNLCRQKNRQTPAKNKENRFATKQGNFTKKDALKSSTEPRTKLSGKRSTKQESISLDKFEHTQFNNSQAPKDRMYEHYPQSTDYMYLNNIGNKHVFNHSYAGRNMILYENQHDSYPKSHSRPNHTQLYQSRYPEHPGQYTEMLQNYRADNLYRGQQMYQRPYDAQYEHRIKDKPMNKRSFEGRTYERNWDFLY